MKKYSTINPAPTPPPQEVDVDAVLKSIDEQFDKANALNKSLVEINHNFNDLAQVIEELQKHADGLCEEMKTLVFSAVLSDESKNELETINIRFKERIEQQFAVQAKHLDELLKNYQVRLEALLEANVKKYVDKKGVWISDKTFWLLFLFIDILLATTVWLVGQALTN